MRLEKKIYDLSDMFYKDENDDLVLNIFWNSLYLAFFLMPLGINLPTPFFIASIVLGIINIFKSKKKYISENKALFLFPLYFIVMAFSLIYTDHIHGGIVLLQRSLPLLLFPIIFLFVKEDALSVRKLFDFLLFGLITSFFINLGILLNDFFHLYTADFNYNTAIELKGHLLGVEFSQLINPSYVSIYILLVLSYYLKNELNSKLRWIIIAILFLYLFLLASVAAYLILMIMSLLLIFEISDKAKKNTMYFLFILGTIVFLNNPRINNLFNESNLFKNKKYRVTTSEKLRILSWETSMKLISESPILGYGIGDANDVLIHKYQSLNYMDNYNKRYNAHNQFLQTWLQTGIIGVVIMIFIFVLLAIRMKRSRNEFSVFLILFISLMFESMLVRFNGIVFFSIIVPLLLKKRSILSSRIIRN